MRKLLLLLVLLVPLSGCAYLADLFGPSVPESDLRALASVRQQVALTESAIAPARRYELAQDRIIALQARINALPVLSRDLKDAVAFLRVIEKKAIAAREAALDSVFLLPPNPVAVQVARDKMIQMLGLMEGALTDAEKELR